MQLAIRRVAYVAGVLLLIVMIGLALRSFPKGKIARANVELRVIQMEAENYRDALLKDNQLDNKDFVKITNSRKNPSLKFDANGQILDPWGEPYVIGQNNGRVTAASRRLEQFNKLSDFQKWWAYE
jgi:hypothetical protein